MAKFLDKTGLEQLWGLLDPKLSAKQDKLTGAPGQVVGFGEDGNAVAQDAPSGRGGSVPSGCILIWSGTSTAVPDGWALCDGNNGTPDLRDRFVLGAGASYAVRATGGEAAHTLTTSEMPSHTHSISCGTTTPTGTSYIPQTYKVAAKSTYTCYTDSSGSGKAHNNMPPYYALCYIMKL